jgi:hypothetical protein
MYDHEHVTSVATNIIVWQSAAQQLPLADLTAMLATWQDELAQSLDAFNGIFCDHAEHHECTDMIQQAIGEVARNATAAAIFTLGISHRAQQAARQN